MIGPEQEKPQFTREESEAIGHVAIDLANAGEEAIWDLIVIKNSLFAQAINFLQDNLTKPGALETTRALKHEVNVMEEAAKRATAILKMEGRDTESILRRKLIGASFGRFGDLDEDQS